MINATNISLFYFYPDKFKEQAQIFFEAYKLEATIGCPSGKITCLKGKTLRTCRFCKRKYPIVSFSKDAHVIPEFLGNRYLISDLECDECNHKFGKYENDLANFLGIDRTIHGIKGKKMPKFKSSDKNLLGEYKNDVQEGDTISIRRFDSFNKTFQFDKENQQISITYEKHPYTPVNVYKALLKIALNTLKEDYVSDYQFAFQYLCSEKYDKLLKGFAIVSAFRMPFSFQYNQPTILHFTKLNNCRRLFSHLFYISFLNNIYQIILPYNSKDKWFYQNGQVETIWCPPLFGDVSRQPRIQELTLNLNSTNRIYNERESIIIPATSGQFDKRTFLNKETGEISEEPFDITQIIGIDLIKVDSTEPLINKL